MRYEYYYCTKSTEQLLDFLSTHRVKHTVRYGDVVFSLYSSQQNSAQLIKTLSSVYNCGTPLVFCNYSAKDRDEAEFLWITPTKYCIDIRNKEQAYEYFCEFEHLPTHTKRVHHKRQVSMLEIAKEPQIASKTAFYAPDTGNHEIFVDHRIKSLAEKHNLKGLEFRPLGIRENQVSSNIFQLTSSHMWSMATVARGHGEISLFCPMCRKESLKIPSSYQMHLFRSQLDSSLDFMVSEPFWGEGIRYPVQVISQKFYKLLQENKLTGNLRVDPLILHD